MDTPPANPDENKGLEALLEHLRAVEKEVEARAQNHAEAAEIYRAAGVDGDTAATLARYHFSE